MNDEQRKQLNTMIENNDDFKDNTNLIRDLKHSELIRMDVEKMIIFKNKNQDLLKENKQEYNENLTKECFLLFTHYKDIYHKLKDDTMDISLIFEMLDVYKDIEDGKIDQNEASYKIGSILKNIYVDTVLNDAPNKTSKNISYSEWYKNSKLKNK
jgi:hypothetical protein